MCGQQIYIIQNEHGQFLKNSKSCSDLDKIFFVCLKAYEKKSKYDIFSIFYTFKLSEKMSKIIKILTFFRDFKLMGWDILIIFDLSTRELDVLQ